MKERNLLQLSLLISVLGLITLFIVSRTIELPVAGIGKITPEDIGKNVRVCGQVVSKFVSKTQHIFLEVKDNTGSVDVVVFNNSVAKSSAQNLEKNQDVCITGTVDEFENKLEILLGKGKIEAG